MGGMNMRIALAGLGTTGMQVAEFLLEQANISLATAVVSKNSGKAGKDIGEILRRKPLGITAIGSESLPEAIRQYRPHVLIDFANPAFMQEHIGLLSQAGVNLVIATTGHSTADVERIKYYTQKYHIGTVMAPNITYGVNVLIELCKMAARLMGDYDFEIIESHHRHKKDAPSGTASRIAEKISETISPANDGKRELDIHSIRAGGIIGDHKVVICGPYDKIELRHESFSRKAFAQGALWAAEFIAKHRGFYYMEDVFAKTFFGYKMATCEHCGISIPEQQNISCSYN